MPGFEGCAWPPRSAAAAPGHHPGPGHGGRKVAAAACVEAEGGPTAGHAKKERLGGDKEAEAGAPCDSRAGWCRRKGSPGEVGLDPSPSALGQQPQR